MFLSLVILSSIGGCVKNILSMKFKTPFLFLSGLSKYKWAVASFAVLSSCVSLPIFSNADASPSGFLVRSAPVASAKNSLCLDIANFIMVAIIGDKSANNTPIIISIIPILPVSLFLFPLKIIVLSIMSDNNTVAPTNTAANNIVLMS